MLTPHRFRGRSFASSQPPRPSPSTPARPEERRRRPRLACATEGWLIPDAGDCTDPWEVRIADVSRLGVGFECTTKMEPGQIVRIRIGRGPMHLAKRVRVVNCRASEHGTYIVGGEFIESHSQPARAAS
jgi:hypothetical protein